MKRSTEYRPALPLHDYGPALQSAVSWLGDRYLLAAPMAARRNERLSVGIFGSSRRWSARYRG
jgi:hypothetical protein